MCCHISNFQHNIISLKCLLPKIYIIMKKLRLMQILAGFLLKTFTVSIGQENLGNTKSGFMYW